jgi:hypothetical protein
MYQTPIYIDNVTKAVQIAFRYSHIVPRIVVTERDMSSLEIVDGEVVFPEEMRADSKELSERFGKINITGYDALLEKYLAEVELVYRGKIPLDAAQDQLLETEIPLLAVAADMGVNLSEASYVSSGMVIAEAEVHLERSDDSL